MQDAEDIDDLVRDTIQKRFETRFRSLLLHMIADVADDNTIAIKDDEPILKYTNRERDYIRFQLRRLDDMLGVATSKALSKDISAFLSMSKLTVNSMVKWYVKDFMEKYDRTI